MKKEKINTRPKNPYMTSITVLITVLVITVFIHNKKKPKSIKKKKKTLSHFRTLHKPIHRLNQIVHIKFKKKKKKKKKVFHRSIKIVD